LSSERKEKKESKRGCRKKEWHTAVQLPEKLISRGKEGAPAGWLSGMLPCSTGCRGARKRRMAMARGGAMGSWKKFCFPKAISPASRRRGDPVAEGSAQED